MKGKSIIMCFFVSTLYLHQETHAHQEHYQTVIIGSGPSGLTAGVYLGRSTIKTLILEGKKPGGTLVEVADIGNWPGEISISGADLMIKMRDHAQQTGCVLRGETVTHISSKQRPFVITTDTGSTYTADTIILAIGLTLKKLHCPGEDEYWGKGIAACVLCEGPLCKDKRVVIVGGGRMALENALLMHHYTKDILLVNPAHTLEGPEDLIKQVAALPITILHNHTVTQIFGNTTTMTDVEITNTITNTRKKVPADMLFLSLDLEPNTGLVAETVALTPSNKIKIDALCKTSIDGMWAAGSATNSPYKQAVVCASQGCIAALEIEKYLNKKESSHNLTQTEQGKINRKDKKPHKKTYQNKQERRNE